VETFGGGAPEPIGKLGGRRGWRARQIESGSERGAAGFALEQLHNESICTMMD
jgi:hypothetical protein